MVGDQDEVVGSGGAAFMGERLAAQGSRARTCTSTSSSRTATSSRATSRRWRPRPPRARRFWQPPTRSSTRSTRARPGPPASSRRSLTKSASSASPAWSWSSSKSRHVSRTASAAASAPRSCSTGRVLPQLGEPVDVRRRRLGAGRDHDEVAVPRLELLEAEQHLLALGAAHRAGACAAPSRAASGRAPRSRPARAPSPPRRARPRSPSRRPRRRAARIPGRGRRRARPRARLAPPRRLRVEQPVDAVEPTARRPARAPSPRPRTARARAPRPPRAPSPPTSRRNGTSWQRERIVSGSGPSSSATSTSDGVRRRLLEILEQRVGGLLVQRVRAEDEVDAPVGLERAHVEVAPQLADGVDPDLVAERLEHVEVGMRAALDARRRRRAARPRTRAPPRRLPTPGGPWKRYACAGPSASAASSSRFASACSGKPWKRVTHLLRDLVGGPGRRRS